MRVANAELREHGVDIEAKNQNGRKLLVTVKGFPKNKQNAEARHWFSQAIFDLVLYKQDNKNVDFAMGLPAGFPTYLNLATRVMWLKSTIPFRIIWVKEDGVVEIG